MTDDWRPISEAKKDRRYLVSVKAWNGNKYVTIAFWDDWSKKWKDAEEIPINPYAFRPIPEPMEEEAE